MSFSIIIPTCGRPTLERSLRSVVPQLVGGDEVIVVTDGPIPVVEELCSLFPGVHYFAGPETHDSGATQRDLGISKADGTYLMFLDDDDIYTRGALAAARSGVATHIGAMHVFRMAYGKASQSPGLILWRHPMIQYCDVGTPMLVVPNRETLPKWVGLTVDRHDFEWATLLEQQFHVRFHMDIITVVRPGPADEQREGL